MTWVYNLCSSLCHCIDLKVSTRSLIQKQNHSFTLRLWWKEYSDALFEQIRYKNSPLQVNILQSNPTYKYKSVQQNTLKISKVKAGDLQKKKMPVIRLFTDALMCKRHSSSAAGGASLNSFIHSLRM